MLKSGVDKAAALRAAIGSPEFQTKLADVHASNQAITAAAPAELHAAVSTVFELSEKAQQALDPSTSAANKQTLMMEARTEVTSAPVMAAINEFKAWVNGHCGSLAPAILATS